MATPAGWASPQRGGDLRIRALKRRSRTDPMEPRAEELKRKAEAFGQGHLFRWWSELDRPQRESLLKEVEALDFPLLQSLVEELVLRPVTTERPELEPAPVIRVPRNDEERRARRAAQEAGEALLREGKTAALVVAGGQGTRLGFPGPKGAYPIAPLSGKSLFAIFAERILAARRRFGVPIPWLVMTSPANDTATRAFFKERAFFGLPPADVHFFVQGTMPAVDTRGRILLSEKHRIALSPDGHGGVLRALRASGMLHRLAELGVEQIFHFQVDNVLVRILDPAFIGYHDQADAEMSVKVVRKAHPGEKVGVIGLRDGRLGVIEYSELTPEETSARGPDGELKYWAGNIAIHMLRVAFLERLQAEGIRLPFHVARKKVPCLDERGEKLEPEEPNGIKFESFIFDALRFARKAVAVEVVRREEFSPLKNAFGENSPETARRDLMALFASWLEEAGIRVPRDETGAPSVKIEISPLVATESAQLRGKLPPGFSVTGDLLLEEDSPLLRGNRRRP